MISTDEELLLAISRHAFDDEAEVVARLLREAEPFAARSAPIHRKARAMVERLRKKGLGLSVEAFLQEYGLSTKEGVAVMCLAEALLRIPDAATAEKLIESNLKGADFERHLGRSDSLFVNASSWGLVLTGKALVLADDEKKGLLAHLLRTGGEPVIRRSLRAAMGLIASQFVLGETIDAAIRQAKPYAKKGYRVSYDMLGEGARSAAQAEAYFASYRDAIARVGKNRRVGGIFERDSISIKLTALHPRYEWRQKKRVMAELLPRLKTLCEAARDAGIAVAIDAEEATRLDLELELFGMLFADPAFEAYEGLGFVLQAYQKRAFFVLDYLIALARRHGRRMPLRLVKGAYWDSEIKAAQVAGLPDYPVFTRKAHTDLSYLACARKMLDLPECFYPQFATHNAHTVAAIAAYAQGRAYEFQRLHGMGEAMYDEVLAEAPCRIYAPVGEHKDLLAYLIRRLLENGANSSFVKVVLDPKHPLDDVLADPIVVSKAIPGEGVALPRTLYAPGRINSAGLDFGNRAQMECLARLMAAEPAPAKPADVSPETLDGMLDVAHAAFPGWQSRAVTERAGLLIAAADRLAARQTQAMKAIVGEGRRVWPDALSEVREAEDFLRFYAAEAIRLMAEPVLLPGPTGERNVLSLHGRGVFAAISPWNFPLSIFMGQVAAALVTGNAVIAKPAEQTPGVAAFAVALLHEAGVPPDVLQLAPGPGETIGAALVADPRIAGVVFTGGFATAKAIQRGLAERDGPILPFIAETGGQNAMIVDSSALPEQAVDDIVNSAFGSAGQRCSSLRVLFLQNEIAPAILDLLQGAMQELRLGDPMELATDIGPLIDAEAKKRLEAYLAELRANGGQLLAEAYGVVQEPPHPTLPHKGGGLDSVSLAQEDRPSSRAEVPAPSPLAGEGRGEGAASQEASHFLAPQLWEIPSLSMLKEEAFGPILHVIRYESATLPEVLRAIHATGYGLTFGMHSRIPDVYFGVAEQMAAGNLYINRGMTGAVVGTQPFGGEGLSGTGPKAGGPLYLTRFVTERTLSINTAAIGGNVELLMGL